MSRFTRRRPLRSGARRRRGLVPLLLRGVASLARLAWRQKGQAAACAALALILWSLWAFARRADVFRIREVQVVPAEALAAPAGLVGRSIWAADLSAIARDLEARHPHLKRVRVIRRLPNVLRIEAVERVPIARIGIEQHGPQGRQVRWCWLDAEGFILAASDAARAEGLPRVQGLSRATPPATPGTRNTSEPVRAALRVLEALRAAQPRLPRRIATVDVGDPRQIRLVTEDEVEIRCGAPEDLPGQLAQLRAVLRALERRETAARYIDLRFGEPVVAPRT